MIVLFYLLLPIFTTILPSQISTETIWRSEARTLLTSPQKDTEESHRISKAELSPKFLSLVSQSLPSNQITNTTVVSPPMSFLYTYDLASIEVKNIDFITPDTIAYLKWGNVYTYNLSTQDASGFIQTDNIASFDWSDTQRQFAVVQNGHLLLLNSDGNLLQDLSAQLSPIHPDAKFVQDCFWTGMQETDNLLKHIKWVRWHPEQAYLILGAIHSNELPHHLCGPKVWLVNVQLNTINPIVALPDPNLYAPEPTWLNQDLLLLDYYTGGGTRRYNVVRVQNGETLWSFDTYASFPLPSPDGEHLANISERSYELVIWDSVSGRRVWHEKFSTEAFTDDTAWSINGRYFALIHSQSLLDRVSQQPPVFLLILDLETQQKWQPEYEFPDFTFPTWLPTQNKAVVFSRQADGSRIFMADPLKQSFELLRFIPGTDLIPVGWSSTGRYLILTDYQTRRALWLLDTQANNSIAPIYELNIPNQVADFGNFIWSPDDAWLLFTQMNGQWLHTPGADITLHALKLSTGNQQQVTRWEIN